MPELLSRITFDPNICHGQPTVRGLRYTVQSVLELLALGMTNEEILADYPDLEADDFGRVKLTRPRYCKEDLRLCFP